MPMDLHMHSSYSDGRNSPEEMIEAAVKAGYEAVALTDHVWRTSAWVPAYAEHMNRLKTTYQAAIRVYSGIEAKVLTLDGDIDADPSFVPLVDLVLGSIHRIPKPGGFYSRSETDVPREQIAGHWVTAFRSMLQSPVVDIIAHPLSELKGFGISQDQLPIKELCEQIAESGKILELNVRYNSPDEPIIREAASLDIPMLISSDSHSVTDLLHNSKLVKEYWAKGFPIVDIGEYLEKRKKS